MVSLPTSLQSTWDQHARQFLRYSGVSVFNVVTGQALLVLFRSGFGVVSWLANILAVLVGSIPSFLLNKRYVWRRSGKVNVRTEMLPFWGMNLAGLVLSTAAVHGADAVWGNQLAVTAASLTAWGSLWVVKYALLDRVLFAQPDAEPVTVS
jgi:putative flippase GtrA